MRLRNILPFLFVFLAACNHIQTGKTLSKKVIDRIQKLNLLDQNEKMYQFYSEFKSDVAGNFFTDKRLAKYWIDKKDKTKDQISFAYYPDIKSIDTVYHPGATYCPYLLVTKENGSQFKVCVDGTQKEIKEFFEEALDEWKQNKTTK